MYNNIIYVGIPARPVHDVKMETPKFSFTSVPKISNRPIKVCKH